MDFGFYNLLRLVLASVVASLLGTAVQAETIDVSGVGLAAPLMQRLAATYSKKQTGDSVNVVIPPLGSTGGIRACCAKVSAWLA